MPDSAAAADATHAGLALDRAGLAERAGVPAFVVDLAVDAGLLTPLSNGSEGERFGAGDLEMLVAAGTLVGEGVAVEELAALAVRHAINVENLIDDAIDVLKRGMSRDSHDRPALVASVDRLVPVATKLVVRHFERTLRVKAMDRIGDHAGSSAGVIIVKTRRLDRRVDPLAVYAAASAERQRSVWLRPDAGVGLAAIGAVETIEPAGADRFSAASAARAVLEARTRRDAAPDAPAPMLVGGFSFVPAVEAATPGRDRAPVSGPDWKGFGDCRLVLPEVTVIDRRDGTWVQAAARVGPDGDEATTESELEQRLASFEVATLAAATDLGSAAAMATVTAQHRESDGDYEALAADAVAAIARGEFHKVVLARTVSLDIELDAAVMLDRLRRADPTCATFAFTVGDTTFLGATPEELVTLDGSSLHATAVAGTALRGDNPEADERLAAELWASAKNRSEHGFVVRGITEALAGLGLVDPAPAEPGLMRLRRLQHLRTPITAQIRRRRTGAKDMDVLRAAGSLHPTAAVGGTPTGAALEFIAGHEGFDRGWFAAPVGCCDLDGNGELGVALRSALTGPDGTHLFAGAGIVAGSVPAEELQETEAKLRVMLDVIGDH